jgi:hypothetical protein
MPNYSSPHMPDSPSSSIHTTIIDTSMIAPDVLGLKSTGRPDSMTTANIWRKTSPELE